ncbi:MAG: tRNA (N(6)-L-threonylcarbamoyladenosine(37)-C(2))-methylthiotransferase [Nanoarchaeota archaeon]|nr:tRNA (N(6)-L-threonylcarbamoyladenosine(37)-C(2))-methylthiotransferase [Nanoarchaeota archaeon]
MRKKIFILTFGCAANRSRSEKMAGLIANGGYALAESEKEADAIILNTCIVKKQTEQKILDRIKSIRKNFSGKKIVLAGCLLEIPEILEKADCDGIIKNGNAAAVMSKLIKNELIDTANNSIHIVRNNPLIDIEEIAEGCLGSCSYCIVRRAKGALKSEPADKIFRNIETAISEGCKEIWLTAQDTACYGFDSGSELPELLDSVCRIGSDFSIHVGMMNPERALKILPRLMEAYKSGKVYKFLHLPVQSGSDNILEKMGRKYKAEDFLHIASEFRKRFPMIQIWTDIIVGFPGETEKDFEKTLALIKTAKPDFTNVSQFGPRPGTPAEKMEQVAGEIKKQRSKRLSEILKGIYLENNKRWIGWEGKALVTEKSRTGFLARNFAYKPIQIRTDGNIIGKTAGVKITKAGSSALFGEIIG